MFEETVASIDTRFKMRATPWIGSDQQEEEEDADYDDEIPAEDSDGVPLRWITSTACMQVWLPCCTKNL